MKPKTAEEKCFHDAVANMPCIACHARPVHVHHVTSDGFKRITKSHKRVVPLCPDCHQWGRNAVHAIGHRKFNELHELNLLMDADELWWEFEGES